MASSAPKRSYSRRFFWFAFAIVAGIGLYTVGWNYVAGLALEQVNASVSALNGNGRRAHCENPEARGYPFRIGVFCRSVMYEDAPGGVGFRAKQLRSAAQIYKPWHILAELDGPATLQAPGLNALDLEWKSMRSSLRLGSDLPERVSVVGEELAVSLDQQGPVTKPLMHAGTAELHLRPVERDLDAAIRFASLQLDADLTGGSSLPPLNGLLDLSINDAVASGRLVQGSLHGRSGTLRRLEVSVSEDTGVSLSGPVEIDEDGLVNAQLQVTLRNPQALAGVVGALVPDLRREIALAFSGLAGGADTATLPLLISKGEISIGFLRLGSIPPL